MRKNRKKNGPVGIVVGVGTLALLGAGGWLLYKTLWAPKPTAPVSGGSGGSSSMPGVLSLLTTGLDALQSVIGGKEPTGAGLCDYARDFTDLQSNFVNGKTAADRWALNALKRAQSEASTACTTGKAPTANVANCWNRLRSLAYKKDTAGISQMFPEQGDTCGYKGTSGLGCWWCI